MNVDISVNTCTYDQFDSVIGSTTYLNTVGGGTVFTQAGFLGAVDMSLPL